jgi:hypothetical protein
VRSGSGGFSTVCWQRELEIFVGERNLFGTAACLPPHGTRDERVWGKQN